MNSNQVLVHLRAYLIVDKLHNNNNNINNKKNNFLLKWRLSSIKGSNPDRSKDFYPMFRVGLQRNLKNLTCVYQIR